MRKVGSAVAVMFVTAGLFAVLAFHAVHARVATQSYFAGVLESSEVYRRLYDDLLLDPAFAPEVDELLGGVNVKREQVVATIKQLVPPEYLETAARELIGHLVAHFDSDTELELVFDITAVVHGVHRVARDALARGLAAVPVVPAPSYEVFRDRLAALIAATRGEGELPEGIPTVSELTPEQAAETIATLLAAARVDHDDAIENAIARGDVAGAVRAAASAGAEQLITRSIDALTHNAYVAEVAAAEGPHYLFGPGDEVTAKVDRKLALIRRINRAAGVGQIAAGALVIAGLAALVWLNRRDRRHALAWTGGALVVAGAVAFVGWYVVRGIALGGLAGVASSKALPAAFRTILGDVLTESVARFTPGFWVPALICVVLGAGLLTLRAAAR